ncbi:hypothetical protein HDV04_001972 [Boothiomyces sp. JEL0838]|nr:hypothetical protein HDV04_001972 [Boothiomyces sp. JEL0838]
MQLGLAFLLTFAYAQFKDLGKCTLSGNANAQLNTNNGGECQQACGNDAQCVYYSFYYGTCTLYHQLSSSISYTLILWANEDCGYKTQYCTQGGFAWLSLSCSATAPGPVIPQNPPVAPGNTGNGNTGSNTPNTSGGNSGTPSSGNNGGTSTGNSGSGSTGNSGNGGSTSGNTSSGSNGSNGATSSNGSNGNTKGQNNPNGSTSTSNSAQGSSTGTSSSSSSSSSDAPFGFGPSHTDTDNSNNNGGPAFNWGGNSNVNPNFNNGTSPNSSSSSSGTTLNLPLIIGVSIGAVVLLVGAAIAITKRNKKNKDVESAPAPKLAPNTPRNAPSSPAPVNPAVTHARANSSHPRFSANSDSSFVTDRPMSIEQPSKAKSSPLVHNQSVSYKMVVNEDGNMVATPIVAANSPQ